MAGKPPLEARWFFARDNGWSIFSDEDDARLEARWRELGGEQLHVHQNAVFTVVNDEGDVVAECESDDGSQSPSRQNKDRDPGKGKGKGKDKDKNDADKGGSHKADNDDDDDDEEEEEEEDSEEDAGEIFKKLLQTPPSGVDELKGKISSMFASGDAERKKEQQRKAAALGVDAVRWVSDGKIQVDQKLNPDKDEPRWKVPVLEDALFDADIRHMVMYPALFKGILVRILRSTYFYSSLTDGSYVPVGYNEPLAQDLENIYDQVRPWERPARENVDSQDRQGVSDEDQVEAVPIPSMKEQLGEVVWESQTHAKIFRGDLTGRLISVVGGSRIVRGFSEADRIAKLRSDKGFLDNLQTAILPWSGLAEDDTEEDKPDNSDRKAQHKTERKEKGETFFSRVGQWWHGAAELPGAQPEQQSGEKSKSMPSLFNLLSPRSQDCIWLFPVHAVERLWTGQPIKEPTSSDATGEAVRGEPSRSELKHDKLSRGQFGQEGETDSKAEEKEVDYSDAPPHLVLCIHGIGQGLAGDFDAISFTYDIERLRNQSKKLAREADMQAFGKGQRVQFLPINWRQGLDFDTKSAGNDNFFTLSDINSNDSIPAIRQIIAKVLLDIPLYMSPYKAQMVNAARKELNRMYRLFVKRNPLFEERGGRVSIIGHSLGSALAMDLLALQPTRVPLLNEYKDAGTLKDAQGAHLLFNTANTFLAGSPVPLFLYLQGAQLIARRGMARKTSTDLSASVQMSDEHHYSPATETLTNCRHISDPVVFAPMGATVEKLYTELLHPLTMDQASTALLHGKSVVPLSIGKLFRLAPHPFALAGVVDELPDISCSVLDHGSKGSENERIAQALRGKARFDALTPLGILDVSMGDAGITGYLDVLSAHTSYWTSPSFCRYLLAVLFSLGPEQQNAFKHA